ncbi:MAG: flagellar hook-basal body complex protein [Chitinivibrionales bacterium]|nr:flagellar hook-basal body complex protein [Chitinivibrionales bacterium]
MVRSLYSGISGLKNHQVAMDVTGNNIANVNTTGFKAGRVTFEEAMAQMLKGASRPTESVGGTNAQQIGLGMNVGSVDMLMTQGNMQSTGKITDLALEGRAFLAYSSGDGVFYSRNGALQMDSMGYLVAPTNGFRLQGMMAAEDGTYPPGTRISDLRIPFGEKAPANATTDVRYRCNLDSDSEGLGTVAHTNRFLATSASTDYLVSMYDQYGQSLGIGAGDVLTISADGVSTPVTLNVTDTTTLQELAGAISQAVSSVNPANSAAVNPANGTIVVSALGSAVNNLRIQSSDPISAPYVANTFNWGPSIAVGGAPASSQVLAPADETDNIADVYDASGNQLGLEDGDTISINGAIGGRTISPVTGTVDSTGLVQGGVTTLGQLADLVRSAFQLPPTDATQYQNQSVDINNPNTPDDRIPDGALVVRGQPELAFALNNVSIQATNNDNDSTAPTRFNTNMVATEIQAARDTGQHSTSITVYDESGDAHIMTTTFTHSGTPGEWLWEITTEGGEEILGGNTGRISFGQDGTPAAFTFDDNSTSLRFDPMNGSSVVSVSLDTGSPGSVEGITQFRSASTTAAWYQDGYPMGNLQEISIDEFGEIEGIYTNGINMSIAKIYLAEFNNPAGLIKTGNSMFSQSNNSGEAVMLEAGVGSTTKVKPGALEMSNVDLASEFTNMITTQRGYQANARVITTSDTLLQELVQLVR